MLGSFALPAVAQPLVGILPSESMNIDTAGVVVTGSSNAWRITAPMRDVNSRMTTGPMFGRMCRQRICAGDAPMLCAARV